MAPTAFISYSSADRPDALALRRLLEGHGCRVWLDVFDIRVNTDVKVELGEGIAGADVVCLLLSPTSVASPWVAEEIARADEHAKARGLRFVPILLRPCRPPDALLKRVMIDGRAGLTSPDVSARIARAVVGEQAVGDVELDAAMQAALDAQKEQLEAAANSLLGKELAAVRDLPIRKLVLSVDHTALLRNQRLALGLQFDPLFSQPMWFLLAPYREGHTWPAWMKLDELDHRSVKDDGPRVDARFQWFDRVEALTAHVDGTDLKDQPATFDIELSGETWTPGGSLATYAGGPTMPHMPQKLEVPSLATLAQKGATFGLSLVGERKEEARQVVVDENDFDVRLVGVYDSGQRVTLYRSTHTALERTILNASFLADRKSPIEREAILGLYDKPVQLAAAARRERLRAAHALLEKPEAQLSPEERRIVGRLHQVQAQLLMFRVFGNAPPPGAARARLHAAALEACAATVRVLEPLLQADPDLGTVSPCIWALSSLADYHGRTGQPDQALPHAERALAVARAAAERAPDEPEFVRFCASAHARLARLLAAKGDRAAAVDDLAAGIHLLQKLRDELPNSGRADDLAEAAAAALRLVEGWEVASALLDRWRALVPPPSPPAPTPRPPARRAPAKPKPRARPNPRPKAKPKAKPKPKPKPKPKARPRRKR